MLDERLYPLWWVESQISEGKIDLLHNDTAIIGIEARKYPGGARELHGMFAAGGKAAIKELVKQAIALAEAAGMDCAAIESRAGWEREFRDLGFVKDRVRIVKGLK
jgi:hypothetical protein